MELVLELSAEITDPVSDGTLLPAATEASKERDVLSELFARSIVMAGAETTGGVETSSTLGRTMRCGICIPGCQSPMREYRSVGVWISIPATDNKLSCDEDFRRDGCCMCIPKISAAVAGAGSPAPEWEYSPDDDGSDSSGMAVCVAMLSQNPKKAGRSY